MKRAAAKLDDKSYGAMRSRLAERDLLALGEQLVMAEIDSVRDGRGRRSPGGYLRLHDPLVIQYAEESIGDCHGLDSRAVARLKRMLPATIKKLSDTDKDYADLCEEIDRMERTWRWPRAVAWREGM